MKYQRLIVKRLRRIATARTTMGLCGLAMVTGGIHQGYAEPPNESEVVRTTIKATDRAMDLARIQSVEAEGVGFRAVRDAASRLSEMPTVDVFAVWEAMRDADPVSQNWLRGIAGNIVSKSGAPSLVELNRYVNDLSHCPEGRAAAMVVMKAESLPAFESQLEQRLEDPSLLIREMAVALRLKKIEPLIEEQPEAAKSSLRQTLNAARHPVQVASVLKQLNDLGDAITTSEAFAMIEAWQVIGPFDNVKGVGFDEAYPPEVDFVTDGRIDLQESHPGKNAVVRWQPITATGDEGKVDLAAAYNQEKGAVAYTYTEFESDQDQEAEIRLGCICANRVWINGRLVMSNEVYHSGSMIDQYTAKVALKKGTNGILIKTCQNEQTESWAQEWEFQCRVTDTTGKGLSPDRSE